MFPVALVMIVREEEDVLGDCLRSVRGMVSQVVVVDTGSRDRTREIALECGAEVYDFPWRDDFAAARNFALDYATQPWILVLDADERMESWDAGTWHNLLQQNTVWSLRAVHEFQRGDALMEQIVYQPRLFPNHPDYRYHGRIHEELRWRGDAIRSQPTEITFRHIGYRKERIAGKDKIRRNVQLHLLDHAQDPVNPRHLYRAAKTCFHAQEFAMAKELYERVMDMEIEDPQIYASVLADYGHVCQHCDASEKALQIILANMGPVHDCPDVWYVLGLLFLSRKSVDDALRAAQCFQRCVELGEGAGPYIHTVGTGSFLALYNLGLIHEAFGDARALDYYRQAAEYGYGNAKQKLESLSGGSP